MFVKASAPDLFDLSMLPAIDEVVMNRHKQFPAVHPMLFKVKGSNRSFEQITEMSGLGQVVSVPEGNNTRYDQSIPAFNKTYKHAQYSLGFMVSHVAKQYDKYGVVGKMSAALGKSHAEAPELLAANVFNTSFTAIGPDGQPLFSASHPLVGGGVQSNMLAYATDPDVTSLQLALAAMRKMKDHRGQLLNISPKRLIVPAELEFVATEILGGTMRADTANHTINAFKKRVGQPSFEELVVWSYLSDPHAWYIQADVAECELRMYVAEKFNVVHETHFDSRSIKTAGWQQFSVGYSNPDGMFGVPSV